MSTLEKKYEAALILLDLMTDQVLKLPNWQAMAVQHREDFETATEDDPELNAAGIEVAHEMLERSNA